MPVVAVELGSLNLVLYSVSSQGYGLAVFLKWKTEGDGFVYGRGLRASVSRAGSVGPRSEMRTDRHAWCRYAMLITSLALTAPLICRPLRQQLQLIPRRCRLAALLNKAGLARFV